MLETFKKVEQEIGLDPEIAVIRGEIWDNCRDWCNKCEIIVVGNEIERKISRCPKCSRILGFIPKAGITEYLKTLPREEREAREKGVWKHLSGLVYKELGRETHIYKDFQIPRSWMKVEGIDPHDARATCWLFGAVSPEEIEIFGKLKNRIYWFDYILSDSSIEDMVKQVKATRALHSYTDPSLVVLDRKWGTKENMKAQANEGETRTWQTELERFGIKRIRLSHSSPGDVELGHKIVREYLKTHYSKVTQDAKPGMLFAKEGCGGLNGPIHYMFNYQYDEKTAKPKEEYKDWCDVVRYVSMEQLTYREPENPGAVVESIVDRMNKVQDQRRRIQMNG
jgi:NAD-dependent SIR2 family protein deacetylase